VPCDWRHPALAVLAEHDTNIKEKKMHCIQSIDWQRTSHRVLGIQVNVTVYEKFGNNQMTSFNGAM
jgi:hypothetical protein